MTQGPILRLILTFSIPLLLGNLFQELYLVVDSIIVGNFCDANALAAVGSAESPSKVMLAMFRGLSVATTVLVSQAVGAGEREKLAKITATSNTFLIVCAVPISIAGAFLARPILTAMHVEEGAAMEYAVAYMVILMLGTLPMMGYNQNAGLLRGMGDGRSPLLFLLIASILCWTFYLSEGCIGEQQAQLRRRFWHSCWHGGSVLFIFENIIRSWTCIRCIFGFMENI